MTEKNDGKNPDQETIMDTFNRNRTEAVLIANDRNLLPEHKRKQIIKLLGADEAQELLAAVARKQ